MTSTAVLFFSCSSLSFFRVDESKFTAPGGDIINGKWFCNIFGDKKEKRLSPLILFESHDSCTTTTNGYHKC